MTPQIEDGMSAVPRGIASDVYCLGPRGRTQTNVYFVRSGSSWVLVDAGWAADGPRIERAAESLFGAHARAAAILLTHCHPDHAGSALQLARRWDCAVYMHPAELPIALGNFMAMGACAGAAFTPVVPAGGNCEPEHQGDGTGGDRQGRGTRLPHCGAMTTQSHPAGSSPNTRNGVRPLSRRSWASSASSASAFWPRCVGGGAS